MTINDRDISVTCGSSVCSWIFYSFLKRYSWWYDLRLTSESALYRPLPEVTSMIASANLSFKTGFDKNPSMPADKHSSRSLSLAFAVIATIGTLMPSLLIFCNHNQHFRNISYYILYCVKLDIDVYIMLIQPQPTLQKYITLHIVVYDATYKVTIFAYFTTYVHNYIAKSRKSCFRAGTPLSYQLNSYYINVPTLNSLKDTISWDLHPGYELETWIWNKFPFVCRLQYLAFQWWLIKIMYWIEWMARTYWSCSSITCKQYWQHCKSPIVISWQNSSCAYRQWWDKFDSELSMLHI